MSFEFLDTELCFRKPETVLYDKRIKNDKKNKLSLSRRPAIVGSWIQDSGLELEAILPLA